MRAGESRAERKKGSEMKGGSPHSDPSHCPPAPPSSCPMPSGAQELPWGLSHFPSRQPPATRPQLWFPKPGHPALDSWAVTRSPQSAPPQGQLLPDERWPGNVRGVIVSGQPRPSVHSPHSPASQHWVSSFHFIHHQSHLAEAILTKSAYVSKAIKRRKEFC